MAEWFRSNRSISEYDVRDTGASHLERAIPVSQTQAATTMHTESS